MSEGMLGGWGGWDFTPSKEAKKVFAETLGKLLGVKYTLIASKSQLVAGTNYKFICSAQDVFPGGTDYVVEALVYQPLKGNAIIRGIKKIGPVPFPVPGGWTDWTFPSSDRANAVLEEALKGMLGAKYTSYGNTYQVVAGRNYCFLCEEIPSIKVPTTLATFVYVSYLVGGKPVVTEIRTID